MGLILQRSKCTYQHFSCVEPGAALSSSKCTTGCADIHVHCSDLQVEQVLRQVYPAVSNHILLAPALLDWAGLGLVSRPIPSFSACNIEKLGMGRGTRLGWTCGSTSVNCEPPQSVNDHLKHFILACTMLFVCPFP